MGRNGRKRAKRESDPRRPLGLRPPIIHHRSSRINPKAFTLIELLVVIGLLALLLGLLVPALGLVRRSARFMVGSQRQREVVLAVSLYASDHHGRYPESVATAAMLGRTWRWQEPRMMKACLPRAAGYRSSMASYLGGYLPQAVTLSCPSSPAPYPYLEDFWQAGEEWDHPETGFTDDPVFGSFCFYWGYIGHLSEQRRPFRGPRLETGQPGYSTLLISDYFGFNHWRSPEAFGSCERPERAQITPEIHEATAHWLQDPEGQRPDRTRVRLRLQAGFIDGHVATYSPAETVTLKVAEALDGTTSAFSGMGLGAGEFYIPHRAMPSRR